MKHYLEWVTLPRPEGQLYVEIEARCHCGLTLGWDADNEDEPNIVIAKHVAQEAEKVLYEELLDSLVIMHGWLCGRVDACTCGFGGPPYGHEPICGLEPLVRLDRIEGWKEELVFLRAASEVDSERGVC